MTRVALGNKEVLPGGDPFAPPPPPRAARVAFTPVCWLFVGLSVVVFLLGVRDRELTGRLLLTGGALAQGEWWRLATWLVTHGGPLHLLFNLSAVWTLGRMLELGVGSGRFLLASFAGALGSAAFVLIFHFDARTVGLSGVILSWLGLALPVANVAARRQLAIWLVQVAVISLLPGVSWSGHLGGFLAGLPAGFALRHGRATFALAMPVLCFALGVAVVLAGQGAFR